ncbi:double homeobox protein 4-like protein 4 [Vulpes vulpes]|uniref:Double homeobox protein 4-like protein 4 n=1 Tax=Vulpes vulpes TaxID=9627 RepID=A0ABM4XA40_VULVU
MPSRGRSRARGSRWSRSEHNRRSSDGARILLPGVGLNPYEAAEGIASVAQGRVDLRAPESELLLQHMASSGTPGGPLPRAPRRRRLVLTASQKGALQAFFQENPYPGITAREHLARELAISESRIQVWVQNQRTRQLRQSRRLDSRIPQGEGPPNGKGQPPGRVPKEGRRKRTSISASQTSILLQAFEEERFPGIGMRESLARKTGIPEARIQVWFQNRRARHPGQSPSGPENALAANHKPSPRGTVPLDQSHLWRVPRSSPNLAPFDPLASMQTQAAGTPPVSSVDVVPPVSCGGFGRLIPGASLVPPTLGGQGGNTAAPRDLGSRSCPGLTRGGGLSPGHADLGLPSPGRCQQPKEHPSKAPLLLQVGPRPPPADPPQHWGHAGPSGTDQAMPRRGQSSQAVMGTAGSQDGTGQQPAPGESPAWWQQPPPPAGPCVPLPPQHQLCTDTSSFLQELLSADEMEEDVHPLWVGPLREEEPPGPLEAPLSEDDYHALLEMLQDSLWPQA